MAAVPLAEVTASPVSSSVGAARGALGGSLGVSANALALAGSSSTAAEAPLEILCADKICICGISTDAAAAPDRMRGGGSGGNFSQRYEGCAPSDCISSIILDGETGGEMDPAAAGREVSSRAAALEASERSPASPGEPLHPQNVPTLRTMRRRTCSARKQRNIKKKPAKVRPTAIPAI